MIDTIVLMWHTFVDFIGILTNSFLIHLCLNHSPTPIKVFSTFIINFALNNLVNNIADMFAEFRLISSGDGSILIYVYNGICKFGGSKFCAVWTSIFLHGISHGLWSLLVSFLYRFHILSHPGLTRKSIIIILVLIYIPSLVQLLTFHINFWDQEEALEVATTLFPQYNLSNRVLSGVDYMSSYLTFYTILHLCIPVFPVYVIIYLTRRKIINYLDQSASLLSDETKAVHAQLLKCLTCQALLPAFIWIAVVCFSLAQFGIVNNEMIEYAVFVVYIPMPTLSPFTYICFVRPYKNYVRSILKRTDLSSDAANFNGKSTTQRSAISVIQN